MMSESADLPSTYLQDFHDLESVKKMKYKKLGNTDLVVSVLGFGGSAIGGTFNKTQDSHSIEVVHQAVKKGINYIDTAPWYGHGRAESVLGKALKEIPREAYYVATKVGRYDPEVDKMFDFSSIRTEKSVQESLERLNLDYIDLIQVHDVEFAPNVDIILNETLPTLEKLKKSGKVKYIGITGYPLDILKCIIARSTVQIDCVLSYCRYTLFDTTLENYLPYFKNKGLGIINAAVIGMGLLSVTGVPSWHPAGKEIRSVCEAAAKFCQAQEVNISKLALYFSLFNPNIDTHLVSVSSLEILKVNFDVAWNGLTAKEKDVMEIVREKYFKNLPCCHWEGIEVNEYRKNLKKFNNKEIM